VAGAKITVVYLLYNAGRDVPMLVDALLRQRSVDGRPPADWLEAIFMDDGSRDDTVAVLRSELEKVGGPPFARIEPNPSNLGLAATVNRGVGLARTPYVLTCHCDVIFGCDTYVAQMSELLERHPDVGAVTGQPAVARDRRLPFAEKLNLVANLMDIFPQDTQGELVAVGFAEGRCDAFRKAALDAVGGYDTGFRTAGEDQILAARLRQRGFRVCQAPWLPYFLGVSGEQDTVGKLVRHMRLFGQAHPQIVFTASAAVEGFAGSAAGGNRRSRTLLRLNHVASVGALALALAAVILGQPLAALAPLGAMLLWKVALFNRHARAVRLTPGELLRFLAIQPLLDLGYVWGAFEGLWRVVCTRRART
jgi:GT2 family glycosyltransferase